MITLSGRGLLLDIEGTTSSIRFVYDVMFPYARRELDRYLTDHWQTPALREACERIAVDAGQSSLSAWSNGCTDPSICQKLVRDEVIRLMDADAKATGLKQLQGLIWRAGFESGEMTAHLYEDVAPAIRRWTQAGRDVRIYSSGSVAAQQLFFGHTVEGDLRDQFRGYYDTTTGSKRESSSYEKIAHDFALRPDEILFLSDVVAELDAARAAGLQTGLCRRPGNDEPPAGHGHAELTSFDQVRLVDSLD